MKLFAFVLVIICTSVCTAQHELESKYGLRKGSLTEDNISTIQSLAEYPENEKRLNEVIRLLDSDSTDNALKIYLIEEYLDDIYTNNYLLSNWLIVNLGLRIDTNGYEFGKGLKQHKYPILYFLVNLRDPDIFSVADLLESDLMSNCELFDDSYTKMFTCKLLAEYLLSSGEPKSYMSEIASKNECSRKNYNSIMKICR